MIEVKRRDYPEQTFRSTHYPARYECSYRFGGMEIAHYYSQRDILYLRTDCIGADFSKGRIERALTSKYAGAYRELFAMLGVDENTSLGEYTYA